MTTSAKEHATICQICLHSIAGDQPVQVCPECRSPYHTECWDELGGCAIYGCPRMVEVKKSEEEFVTIWGSSDKECPMCAEKIPAAALQCPYCKAAFKDIRPVEREELLQKTIDPALARNRRKAIWLLVFSVLGFTSPLALVIGGLWYHSRKTAIKRSDPTVRDRD